MTDPAVVSILAVEERHVYKASCSTWVWSDAWYAKAIVTSRPETMIASRAKSAAAWILRLDRRDARCWWAGKSSTTSSIVGGRGGGRAARGGVVVLVSGRPRKLGLTLRTNGGMEGGEFRIVFTRSTRSASRSCRDGELL